MIITPALKMEIIQTIFRDVQDNFSDSCTLRTHAQKLDSYEIEFRSIAYEASSFCIGLKDLEAGNNLSSWKMFLKEIGKPHATQIYVGLGWAYAQKQIDPSNYLAAFEPLMRYRVLDGYGYYEGIFRKRKSILSQQKMELNDTVALGAYDQGLGRSLWYINEGNIDEVKNTLERFPKERQKDLWRGLGIAISYVGGCSEEMLRDIFSRAGSFRTQLATGAVMSLVSRNFGRFVSNDSKLACSVWCSRSSEEITRVFEPQLESSYTDWISKIEASF